MDEKNKEKISRKILTISFIIILFFMGMLLFKNAAIKFSYMDMLGTLKFSYLKCFNYSIILFFTTIITSLIIYKAIDIIFKGKIRLSKKDLLFFSTANGVACITGFYLPVIEYLIDFSH